MEFFDNKMLYNKRYMFHCDDKLKYDLIKNILNEHIEDKNLDELFSKNNNNNYKLTITYDDNNYTYIFIDLYNLYHKEYCQVFKVSSTPLNNF